MFRQHRRDLPLNVTEQLRQDLCSGLSCGLGDALGKLAEEREYPLFDAGPHVSVLPNELPTPLADRAVNRLDELRAGLVAHFVHHLAAHSL